MSTVSILVDAYQFQRQRTLGLLDTIEKLDSPTDALARRPGAGRAHIAWQLMHIGITEEIFATERLNPEKPAHFVAFWPRFRGGSAPDDNIPAAAQIREILNASREHLLETLATLQEEQLGEIPANWSERNLTYLQILHILGWHEAHHQGQAHLTLNLYKASIGN